MKTAREGYVTIKSWPHCGEKAVPCKGRRVTEAGVVERAFIMLNCQHGEHIVWLSRQDI